MYTSSSDATEDVEDHSILEKGEQIQVHESTPVTLDTNATSDSFVPPVVRLKKNKKRTFEESLEIVAEQREDKRTKRAENLIAFLREKSDADREVEVEKVRLHKLQIISNTLITLVRAGYSKEEIAEQMKSLET